jgi:DNA excision repair protein ERCC-6
VFEGERISFLVKTDTTSHHADQVIKEAENKAMIEDSEDDFSSDESHRSKKRKLKKKKEKRILSCKQDDYVLSKLFKNKDSNIIHSALQHDVIEGSNMQSTPDYTLVEAEAEQVAKDAIKALKRSRAQCFSAVSGVPTWTGLSGKMKKIPFNEGGAGLPKPSSSLLTAMRSRHKLEDSNDSVVTSVDPSHEILLHDLRSFIAFQSRSPGEATTQEVLDKFKTRLPSHQTPVFKAFLNKMCDFERRNGTGVWILKQDF